MRRFVQKAVVFSASTVIIIVITFVLLEIGLRFFPGVIPAVLLIRFEPGLRENIAEGRFATHRDTIMFDRNDEGFPFWIWKPFAQKISHLKDPGVVKTVTMDEIGFCNLPGSYQQATIDIITVGDSFTFCTTINPEDTWTKQLSDLTNLTTYNLGKGGIGLYEYLQIFERFGIQKSPRFVVMNVFEGNDLRDAYQYHSYRKSIRSTGRPPRRSPQYIIYQFLREGPLGRHSYACNLVLSTVAHSYSQIGAGSIPNFRYRLVFTENSVPFNLENTDSVPFNLENTDVDEVIYARRLLAQEVDLEFFTEALKTFVQLSRGYDFVPIVTYTPSAYTAYAANVVFEEPDLGDVMRRYSQEQRDFFRSKARELGYIYIDFTSGLQSAAPFYNKPQTLLYYQTNVHLTKYGHRIIAETLSEAMHTLGILK